MPGTTRNNTTAGVETNTALPSSEDDVVPSAPLKLLSRFPVSSHHNVPHNKNVPISEYFRNPNNPTSSPLDNEARTRASPLSASHDPHPISNSAPTCEFSSPKRRLNLTPTLLQYKPLNISPPAVMGDPTRWLIPRPFHATAQMSPVEGTQRNRRHRNQANFDISSISTIAPSGDKEEISEAKTPSSLGSENRDSSSLQSPYFRKRPSRTTITHMSGSQASSQLDYQPQESLSQITTSTFSDMSPEPFTVAGSDRFPGKRRSGPTSQYPWHNKTLPDVTADDCKSPDQYRSPSYNHVSRSSAYSPQVTSHIRPGNFETRNRHGRSAPGYTYGPSVMSWPVAQTLTPSTSPYRLACNETGWQRGANPVNISNTREYPEAAVLETQRTAYPPSLSQTGFSNDPHARIMPQDSSILSPPLNRATPWNALLYGRHHNNTRVTPTPNIAGNTEVNNLDFDLSSDSETEHESVEAYALAPNRPQHVAQSERCQTVSEFPDDQDCVICAVSESRSSDIMGIAAINMTLGQVDLIRIINDNRYHRLAETLWRMPTQPQVFIVLKKVVDEHNKSTITEYLRKEFPRARLVGLGREYWNESEGLRLLDRFAWRTHVKAVRSDLEHNFYVSCAFSAVCHFLDLREQTVF